ncbi:MULTISPECIES: ABC transporter ATP-binding protein [unclassified Staphylococcus]|uniref:ABC transporter ATP-binding protein n=1 Tax=unclassified Staphylococcus TaxID=91994 RepID=UPI0021D261DD|nr:MULTISPECIES: ABC transporter ATP-binding protein [unclassified Staphylococcus]UXR73753.1 ABC transporter ATP-binding protein/permease [Staphylococcus sp. IVB6238]UXR76073.1 ABC transporter ATP-binding protein/permease [Staphylococcus sp. IVB6233]UXR80271.1 ABC transporter ATP-binding protein/permease [Staphylococcus sp. IVB6218]
MARQTKEVVQLSAKEQWQVLLRLLKYTLPFKKLIALALVTLSISIAASMSIPYIVKVFIDEYLLQSRLSNQQVIGLLIAFIVIQIVGAITTYLSVYYLQYLALKVIQQLRIDAFHDITRLGMAFFDKTPSGSIVSRLTNDTEAIIEMFTGVLTSFLQAFLMIIASFVMMFVLDIRVAFFALIFVPIIVVILALYRKFASVYFNETRQRLSDLNAKLAESIEGIKIIQVFNQQQRLREEFGAINESHYEKSMKTIQLDSLMLRPAMTMLATFATVMILGYFGVLSFSETVTAGVIYAFIQYMQRFFEPINQVSQNLNIFQQAIVSASRVFKMMDNETLAPVQKEEHNKAIQQGRIEFKNVSFSYDGTNDVLHNISFTAEPGQTVALVGHTGSGKSTIANLFMRFYEFERGDILIDGVSIKSYTQKTLKQSIGLVLQDPFIFYGTVASNIRLYHPTMTFEQVEAAAKFVHAHDFIMQLSDGYDHQVIEQGRAFSSGQRQLIAFARTMAMDPKILLLDEATANIDSETEEAIQESLAKMRHGRTTLAIAHRLSTIQDADQILVLNKGVIAERGTHDELIAQRGIYYNLYQLQLRGELL